MNDVIYHYYLPGIDQLSDITWFFVIYVTLSTFNAIAINKIIPLFRNIREYLTGYLHDHEKEPPKRVPEIFPFFSFHLLVCRNQPVPDAR